MPSRAPRPCAQAGCWTLTQDKSGRCPKHPKEHGWDARERMLGNRHARGYGKGWDRLRKMILERDSHLCQRCKAQGLYRAGTHVDHIQAKAIGGTDDPSNLQVLCVTCHRIKTSGDSYRLSSMG